MPHILNELPALNTQQLLCHLCEEIKQMLRNVTKDSLHQNEQNLSQAVTIFSMNKKNTNEGSALKGIGQDIFLRDD